MRTIRQEKGLSVYIDFILVRDKTDTDGRFNEIHKVSYNIHTILKAHTDVHVSGLNFQIFARVFIYARSFQM